MSYNILFFSIPILLIILFFVSLYRYIYAKRCNQANPGTFTDKEIINRKTMLITVSVIAGIFIIIVIGFIALMFMAVAFM